LGNFDKYYFKYLSIDIKMTWGNPPKFIPNLPKKGKLITPEDLAKSGSEDGEQAALFAWAAQNLEWYPQLKWLHAIPNGGDRHVATAAKMVATGLRSGIWDIFLPLPIQTEWAKQYAGLYIEMKHKKYKTHRNGGLTAEQVEFRDYAFSVGYFTAVCYSWEEAKDILIRYIEFKV
jgi:hypothetical protein